MSSLSRTAQRWLLVLLLVPLILTAAYSSWMVYDASDTRANIKDDYSEVNGIQNGILSVESWKEEIKSIIASQIENFELTEEQDSLLQRQISEVLVTVIEKGDSVVQANDDTFKKKLRKIGYNMVVDKEDLKSKVPLFSRSIVNELTKEKSKDRLRKIATQKLEEYAEQTQEAEISNEIDKIVEKYDKTDEASFNKFAKQETDKLEVIAYRYTFIVIGIVFLFLIPWIILYRKKLEYLRKPLFILSVILALVVLLAGLMCSMIEIDARIAKLEFILLGEKVTFNDQILFYRSKSILEVVQVLLQTKKFDSILVGGLILAFSVLLPMSKLISTEIYLLGNEKTRKNKLVYWLSMKSGKWSMADVMVVAIFMAYVGFNGILDNQLEIFNTSYESVNSIATNLTSLQPGFILFLTFVLFSLLLSHLLKWITPKLKDPFDS